MPIAGRWAIYEYDRNSYMRVASGLKGDVIDVSDMTIMREDDEDYMSEQSRKMIECCNQAVLEMIQDMALHDELVVMTDLRCNPVRVKAREVHEKNPGLKLRDMEYTPIDVDIKQIINKRTNLLN